MNIGRYNQPMDDKEDATLPGFGGRIRGLMDLRGWKYHQFSAELAKVGGKASPQAINKWVNKDGAGINLANVMALARLFRKPPAWILFGDQPVSDISSDALAMARAWDSMPTEQRWYILAQLELAKNYGVSVTRATIPNHGHSYSMLLQELTAPYKLGAR